MRKEIPILFSAAMVQAIMDGRKSQTRRQLNPQPEDCTEKHLMYKEAEWKNNPMNLTESLTDKGYFRCSFCGNGVTAKNNYNGIKCPYGQPGDLLWVRESFNYGNIGNGMRPFYKADNEKPHGYSTPWKPSIHMPKEVARIWLEVTDVRVERLNDISENDAIAEGILIRSRAVKPYDLIFQVNSNPTLFSSAKSAFNWLWQSINGPESWDANPWVWVVSYKVVSKTGKPRNDAFDGGKITIFSDEAGLYVSPEHNKLGRSNYGQ